MTDLSWIICGRFGKIRFIFMVTRIPKKKKKATSLTPEFTIYLYSNLFPIQSFVSQCVVPNDSSLIMAIIFQLSVHPVREKRQRKQSIVNVLTHFAHCRRRFGLSILFFYLYVNGRFNSCPRTTNILHAHNILFFIFIFYILFYFYIF